MKINDYTIPEQSITEFFTPLQLFQYYDKYSRFLWDLGRREDWHETIARTTDFLRMLSHDQLPFEEYQTIFDLMYLGEITPSMRLLNMAGAAAERDNACLYNCSYLAVDSIAAFDEMLSLSMSGSGVGFSVESHLVNKLPVIPQLSWGANIPYLVVDTQRGWQDAIKAMFENAFNMGRYTAFDFSHIRPSGSPLYTKGGYSSGPEILQDVIEKCTAILTQAQGRKLTTVEAFDLMTILPEAGISGGVRRAATIALFDATDKAMLNAKTGNFAEQYPNRYNANISAVWPEQVTRDEIKHLTEPLFNNGFGEPGIFKRDVALTSCDRRRWTDEKSVGVNPCGEIFLNNMGFCNLSSVICKPTDDLTSLANKTHYATLVGDIQSLATHFPYLRKEWTENARNERLLGVSHVGHANCPEIRDAMVQRYLKDIAIQTDLKFSEQFGVPQSAAITSIKPSGNTSTLYNVGPGINPIHDEYSRRNVTVSKNTAMYRFLSDYGVHQEEYPGKPGHVMFAFPYKAPVGSVLLENVSGIDQLNYWKIVKENLTEHNPSCSITYTQDEVEDIQSWLYQNQHLIGGIALFPKFDNSYALCPIQKIDKTEYNDMVSAMPNIDWEIFHDYEHKNEQNMVVECSGGRCDISL